MSTRIKLFGVYHCAINEVDDKIIWIVSQNVESPWSSHSILSWSPADLSFSLKISFSGKLPPKVVFWLKKHHNGKS